MDRLHVATLNIRNLADRWAERQSLLYADMAALQPDVIGLQEVVYVLQQDRLIGAAGEASYSAHRGWAGRPEYGNSVLVKAPLVAEAFERLELSFGRSALRVRLTLAAGGTLVIAVPSAIRRCGCRTREQTRSLVDWLASTHGQRAHRHGRLQRRPDEPATRG
jgi:endonuclease/exonuclease/phosphatase family metal-dependent hydrolase